MVALQGATILAGFNSVKVNAMKNIQAMKSLWAGLAGALMAVSLLAATGAQAQQTSTSSSSKSSTVVRSASPRIAVTDLSYEDKVREHFVKYDSQSSFSSSNNANGAVGSYAANGQMSHEASMHLETGDVLVIDRGELRKFTADIKGQMIKAGYTLVQGRPWIKKDTDGLYDVIQRIKDGYFPNADMVLFGSINSVDVRNDRNPIQGSDAVNFSLNVELMVEFSLIDAKTGAVVASFSTTGEGSDSKLVNSAGASVSLSKTRAVQQVSRSLGEQAVRNLLDQYAPASVTTQSNTTTTRQQVTNYH
jgi:hypothetical protein